MIVTLNEFRRAIQKALFGLGAPAGLDEEASEAALWLEARGFAVLAMVVEVFENWEREVLCLNPGRGTGAFQTARFDAAGATAFLLASRICDAFMILRVRGDGPAEMTLRGLRHGLFLLPVIFSLARRESDAAIECRGLDLSAVAGPKGLTLFGDWSKARTAQDFELRILPKGASAPRQAVAIDGSPKLDAGDLERRYRASLSEGLSVDDEDWRRLGSFARLSYVADSEESRLKGAGEGGGRAAG